jgi:enoyl-CoA hydratase/carnithine racemase
MSVLVDFKADSSVAILRLNKPPINALDEAALHELTKAVANLEDDPAIKAVIITSAIKGIFCAGGDLKFWPRHYAKQAAVIIEAGQRAFGQIERLTKPCIAAIQGQVIGDGFSLALACDLRLASQDAVFQLPEVSYGFIPGWGTIGRLVQTVGTASAAELLLIGDPVDAARAWNIGLINRVAAPKDLISAAETLATRLAEKPPMALRYAKAALIGSSTTQTPDQTACEARCFAAVWGSPEWEQGLQKAFGRTAKSGG